MTISAAPGASYDPYDVELNASPYAMYERLREDAPLYYNNQYDFYAVSRYEDVDRGLLDHATFSSARGVILELIKMEIDIGPGFIAFEDPPLHDIHRRLLARMFTPRKIAELEPKIREFCARSLDPLIGTGKFDFVLDLGAQVPMRAISRLLGIPEGDQESVRDRAASFIHTEAGQPMDLPGGKMDDGEGFARYIEWRAEHPSNDIMTELLNVEFEDDQGCVRRLTREEILNYVNGVATAGNETTTRLIGWAGKVLAEHPDQRQQLVDDPGLIPGAVEELLRYEPPAPHLARYVTRDVEFHGQTVPAGSALLLIIGAANRDPRQFPNGDVFDIHRKVRSHIAFGVGTHYCLGSALARLEAKIAIEEILKRFPEWEVDIVNARLASTSIVRGWDSLPVFTT
ncbi:cytochrome P450 [Mycobacterium sp.]|uniref:cytochrome P450 n=1 Tax=Mycobacterium sp. TaxID=1785 RepID=UPI002DA9309E|nr:cytochrome P450 [Mycobacterium sp.]